MTMTIDTITAMEPLKNSAAQAHLHDIAVFVPDEDDIDYEDNSYIFFADTHRAQWSDIIGFKKLAEHMLGGNVHVLRRGEGDSPQLVKADTGAIPLVLA